MSTTPAPLTDQYLKRLAHRLKRLQDRRSNLESLHSGNENTLTYWEGFDLGYVKAQIRELEDFIEIFELRAPNDSH